MKDSVFQQNTDMQHEAYYQYLPMGEETFFTLVFLPQKGKAFPTVVCRSPYVKDAALQSEEEVLHEGYQSYCKWLRRGYAVVFQHCRGQGKSTGAFVPYVHEREDGLALRQWIRTQPFYNGQLFLLGKSYTASLHYATAPFEEDVKGAVFEVQDCRRYNLWYRNGQMRKGHANWHFKLYKHKCGLDKRFDMTSFSQRPLQGLSERVLQDRAEDFEQMLAAPSPSHGFWSTRFGGADAVSAIAEADIPILLTTGYNDYYVGGVFDMWNSMKEQTKKKSALLVSPYNHGDGCRPDGLQFPMGKRREQFGDLYPADWFDHIRTGAPLPFPTGVITYYRTFENRWQSDFYNPPTESLCLRLGEEARSFRYDPERPTAFLGEGAVSEEECSGADFIRVLTEPLDRDVFIKGKMRARLTVTSDCEDTSFYVRLSIRKPQQTYVLRHDITSLCFQTDGRGKPDAAELEFCFDEYAFLLQKGERLQIDIGSTDDNTYVPHTNRRGEYALQTRTQTATNTVFLQKSYLYLPVERI